MWRIHFTGADLARVRVAPGADPMVELQMSMHILGSRIGEAVFDPWRRRVVRQGVNRLRPLLTLAPPWGYSPDFLTPAGGAADLHDGLDRVMSTPRSVLRRELGMLGRENRLPGWADDLAAGDPQVLRRLTRIMRAYYDAALAPHWHHACRQVDDERHRLARAMASGGLERLLSCVSPLLRWEPPVLYLASKRAELDIVLNGGGIVLQPSFFAFGDVTPVPAVSARAVATPSGRATSPLVLVYPVRHELGWLATEPPRQDRLHSVLGRTRAQALDTLADAPCTTTELAARLGLSLASASQQAKVLREAGLVASAHEGKAVIHSASPLGVQLLEGRPGT